MATFSSSSALFRVRDHLLMHADGQLSVRELEGEGKIQFEHAAPSLAFKDRLLFLSDSIEAYDPLHQTWSETSLTGRVRCFERCNEKLNLYLENGLLVRFNMDSKVIEEKVQMREGASFITTCADLVFLYYPERGNLIGYRSYREQVFSMLSPQPIGFLASFAHNIFWTDSEETTLYDTVSETYESLHSGKTTDQMVTQNHLVLSTQEEIRAYRLSDGSFAGKIATLPGSTLCSSGGHILHLSEGQITIIDPCLFMPLCTIVAAPSLAAVSRWGYDFVFLESDPYFQRLPELRGDLSPIPEDRSSESVIPPEGTVSVIAHKLGKLACGYANGTICCHYEHVFLLARQQGAIRFLLPIPQGWVGVSTAQAIFYDDSLVPQTELYFARSIIAIEEIEGLLVVACLGSTTLECKNSSGIHLWQFEEHATSVVALCRTQKKVISASEDGEIFLWNPKDHTDFRYLARHPEVHTIASNGTVLCSLSDHDLHIHTLVGRAMQVVEPPQFLTQVGCSILLEKNSYLVRFLGEGKTQKLVDFPESVISQVTYVNSALHVLIAGGEILQLPIDLQSEVEPWATPSILNGLSESSSDDDSDEEYTPPPVEDRVVDIAYGSKTLFRAMKDESISSSKGIVRLYGDLHLAGYERGVFAAGMHMSHIDGQTMEREVIDLLPQPFMHMEIVGSNCYYLTPQSISLYSTQERLWCVNTFSPITQFAFSKEHCVTCDKSSSNLEVLATKDGSCVATLFGHKRSLDAVAAGHGLIFSAGQDLHVWSPMEGTHSSIELVSPLTQLHVVDDFLFGLSNEHAMAWDPALSPLFSCDCSATAFFSPFLVQGTQLMIVGSGGVRLSYRVDEKRVQRVVASSKGNIAILYCDGDVRIIRPLEVYCAEEV